MFLGPVYDNRNHHFDGSDTMWYYHAWVRVTNIMGTLTDTVNGSRGG